MTRWVKGGGGEEKKAPNVCSFADEARGENPM